MDEILSLGNPGIDLIMNSIKSPNFFGFGKSEPQDVMSTPVKTTSFTPFDTKYSICSLTWSGVSDREFPLA